MKKPVRQCISCRTKGPKDRFLRVVRHPGGEIAFDSRQRIPGRGAYLCRDSACVAKARERNLLGEAFRAPVPGEMYLILADALKKNESLDTLLGFAARAGKLVLGATALEAAVKKGGVGVIVLDGESRDTTRKRVETLCDRYRIPLIRKTEGRPVADAVGKPNCRCAGVRDAGFAHSILASVERDPS